MSASTGSPGRRLPDRYIEFLALKESIVPLLGAFETHFIVAGVEGCVPFFPEATFKHGIHDTLCESNANTSIQSLTSRGVAGACSHSVPRSSNSCCIVSSPTVSISSAR